MQVVTPGEMGIIDQRAIKEFGIPGIVLMENAALQVYRILSEECALTTDDRITVVCGTGNNGGDGFAVARHLYLNGYKTNVVVLNPENRELTGDACTNYNILVKLCVPLLKICTFEQMDQLRNALQGSDCIIDAIFGTGLARHVSGLYKDAITEINKTKAKVVSVDIPSGINGSNGSVMGTAVTASHTITFGYPKRGHLFYPGRKHTGKLHVVPISLPADSSSAVNVRAFTLDDMEIASGMKLRPQDGYKTTFGRVGIVAGSVGFTGAAYLATQAALRSGAGLVTLGAPSSLIGVFESILKEAMTVPLYDGGTGRLQTRSIDDILNMAKSREVLAVGPGLSRSQELEEIIREIILRTDIPIVLDADGLNNISDNVDVLSEHKAELKTEHKAINEASIIITPHPGEMSRLTGMSIAQIQSDPAEVALAFAKRYNVVVLLKGAASVVAEPGGRLYINRPGNSGMGTGGSGDVLTGVVASLVAQGYDLFDAAVFGCYIHGSAGDRAALKKGEISMIAGDIIDCLPETFDSLYKIKLSMT